MSLTCVISLKVKKWGSRVSHSKLCELYGIIRLKYNLTGVLDVPPETFTLLTSMRPLLLQLWARIYSVTCVAGFVTCVTFAIFFQISSNLTMKITWLGFISLEIPLTYWLKPIELRICLFPCNKWSDSTSLKGSKYTET